MSTTPLTITIIICTHDRPDDLCRCLESIAAQSVLPDDIIVVSESDTSCPEGIVEKFSHLLVRVIDCHEHNISKSRNAGLYAARTDIVLFIDDDATAREGWIRTYIEAFERRPEVWIIGGDVYDSRTDPPILEFSKGLISSFGSQILEWRGLADELPGGYMRHVKGCNFGMRRRQAIDIGGFDPFYAFAFEESDIALSLCAAGGLVEHEPSALVDHAHSPGFYRQDGLMDRNWYVEYASHTMFMLKHTPRYKRFLGRLFIYRRLLKLTFFVIFDVLRGNRSIATGCGILVDARRGVCDAYREFGARSSVTHR